MKHSRASSRAGCMRSLSEPLRLAKREHDSSVALDLTFLRITRGNAGRNVKSATLARHARQADLLRAPPAWVHSTRSLIWTSRCRRAEKEGFGAEGRNSMTDEGRATGGLDSARG